jgi:hypothetical protein
MNSLVVGPLERTHGKRNLHKYVFLHTLIMMFVHLLFYLCFLLVFSLVARVHFGDVHSCVPGLGSRPRGRGRHCGNERCKHQSGGGEPPFCLRLRRSVGACGAAMPVGFVGLVC